MNFEPIAMKETREKKDEKTLKCPKNFDLMKQYASKLSKPFQHCRVDLYNVEGTIYFGEITFYHGNGMNHIEPFEWNLKLGSWI